LHVVGQVHVTLGVLCEDDSTPLAAV
jgi:hypothetical protein